MVDGEIRSARDVSDSTSGAEVVRFMQTQFSWIAGSLVFGAIVGFAISYASPRQWEASLVLQIGQIEDGGSPVFVDPPSRAVQRIEVKSFKDQVLRTLSLPIEEPGDKRARLIRKTLHAQVVPNTDLVDVSVRDFSPASATATLRVVQNQLIASTAGVVADASKRLQNRLNDIDAQIADLQTRMRLKSSAGAPPAQAGAGGQVAVNQLLGNMLDVSSASLLVDAESRRAQIVREMSPDHTYNTKPLGEIAVSAFPVAPRRGVYALLGALFGFWGGLMIGGFRWRRR